MISPSQTVPTTVVITSAATDSSVPAATTASVGAGGDLILVLLTGAVAAAAVTGLVNSLLATRSTRIEEQSRVRVTMAEAFQAYADYKELPYAIRRRRIDRPEDERIRLSEELRKIQSRLSYYQAWSQGESTQLGAAYAGLIAEARRVAGTAMRDAWLDSGSEHDRDMNIGADRVDLTSLAAAEDEYIRITAAHRRSMTLPWWRRMVTSRRRNLQGDQGS